MKETTMKFAVKDKDKVVAPVYRKVLIWKPPFFKKVLVTPETKVIGGYLLYYHVAEDTAPIFDSLWAAWLWVRYNNLQKKVEIIQINSEELKEHEITPHNMTQEMVEREIELLR